MMKAYKATKPVRLDKDYFAGDIIPAEAVDPKMEKRLTEWGKIQAVDLPEPCPAPAGVSENIGGEITSDSDGDRANEVQSDSNGQEKEKVKKPIKTG
jgi:hypothetical protein